jgi:hypothetical protein
MTYNYDIQTEAIVSAGLKLLCDNLGTIETEIFLLNVNRKGFDYTKWRENLYKNMSLKELLDYADEKIKGYTPPDRVIVI